MNIEKIFRVLFVLGLVSTMWLLNYSQQTDKEFLYELFTDTQDNAIREHAHSYRYLLDIKCAQVEKNEYLDMYLQVYEERVKLYLDADYISEKTRTSLHESLEYIPCDCK